MKRFFGMLAGVLATAGTLALPGTATADITGVFSGQTISGNPIPCVAQGDGVRVCHGTDGGGGTSDLRLKSFDGQPLEAYVILPPKTGSGSDGSYPLIVQSHGYGGQAGGPNDTEYGGPTADTWAKDGYAVLQLTARGFGDSCGTVQSRQADLSGCLTGYVRLDDDRYEVRDIQYATGLLVDQGVINPDRVGATGESYGGGVSLQLATLKDRVMNADGSLSPWVSPHGTPISLAAAAPVIPWSDLVYSLLPNGRTLDYQVTSPTADLSPIGVEKASFVAGLFASGEKSGYYAPAGVNSQADLTKWYALINAGEPYDSNPMAQDIVTQIARYHSAFYLLNGAYGTAKEPPPPLLISNGFTDDLFPVDEALRYYNLEHHLYPSDPVSLFDYDGGHMRGQNKGPDLAVLSAHIQTFLEHYVGGAGTAPATGATALTQTCPSSAPSGGPFTAPSWAALHPGEVDYKASGTQTISSSAGDPSIAKAIDPVAGGGACATVSSADQGSGVATYRLPAAKGAGYTLLGSATVAANLSVTGQFGEIAERLWDVNQSTHTQTLVARGVYRIDPAKPDGVQVFQLHPGAWHFAAGHVPKLELLGQDAPYARPSNGTFSITVSGLQLRLPVHEQPGSTPPVGHPKPPFHPHPPARCSKRPTASISSASGSRRGLSIRGHTRERPCASAAASARRRQHVVRVYVAIYRGLGHARCRFVTRSGHLTSPRRCAATLKFKARGTRNWSFHLRGHVPPGRYAVWVSAVDGMRRHSRPAWSALRVR